jgi:hypothetical protein
MKDEEHVDAMTLMVTMHRLVIQELKRLRKEMRPFLVGERTDFVRHHNKAKEYAVLAELASITYRVVNHYRKLDSVTIAGIRRNIALLIGYRLGDDLQKTLDTFDREWRKKTFGKSFHGNGD